MTKEEKAVLELLHRIAETLETDKVCDDKMTITFKAVEEGVIN